MNKLEQLIQEGKALHSCFTYIAPASGVLQTFNIYRVDNQERYYAWISKAKLFLSQNFDKTPAYDDFLALTKNITPDKHLRMVAILESLLEDYKEKMAKKERFFIIDEPKQDITPANRKTPKIFISHSSKDKEFAEALIELFEKCGFDEKDIFCSSVSEYWVGIQKDFCSVIREHFENYQLYIIFIHSPRLYESPISMNEMGAAWVLRNEYYSLLTSDMEYNLMTGVVSNREIAIKVNDDNAKARLNEMFSQLVTVFKKTTIDQNKWERYRDKFLKDVNNIEYASCSPQNKPEAVKNIGKIFTIEELSIISKWTSSDDCDMWVESSKDGDVICLGATEYKLHSKKELVQWRDLFHRMEDQELIESYDYDDDLELDLYRLTMKAYKLFDKK